MGYGGDYGAGALVTGINNIVTHFARKKAAAKEYKHFGRRYQIMRADLEKAGLNPMLALGSPAMVPPSGEAGAGPGGLAEGMGAAVSSAFGMAMQARMQRQQIANMKKEGRNMDYIYENLLPAQVDETWSRSGQASAQAANTQSHTRLNDQMLQYLEMVNPDLAKSLRAARQIGEAGVPGAERAAAEARAIPWWVQWIGKAADLMNRAPVPLPRGRR